jgi:predicted amidohydrolase
MTNFQSLYTHELIRIAACVPRTEVAGVAVNLSETVALVRQGHECKAALMAFPEFGLSAYTIEDLCSSRMHCLPQSSRRSTASQRFPAIFFPS